MLEADLIRSSKFQSSVGCARSLIGSLKLQAARKHRTQHLHCKPLGRAGDGNPRRILHRILHHILQKILQKNSSGRSARNGQRQLMKCRNPRETKPFVATAMLGSGTTFEFSEPDAIKLHQTPRRWSCKLSLAAQSRPGDSADVFEAPEVAKSINLSTLPIIILCCILLPLALWLLEKY